MHVKHYYRMNTFSCIVVSCHCHNWCQSFRWTVILRGCFPFFSFFFCVPLTPWVVFSILKWYLSGFFLSVGNFNLASTRDTWFWLFFMCLPMLRFALVVHMTCRNFPYLKGMETCFSFYICFTIASHLESCFYSMIYLILRTVLLVSLCPLAYDISESAPEPLQFRTSCFKTNQSQWQFTLRCSSNVFLPGQINSGDLTSYSK